MRVGKTGWRTVDLGRAKSAQREIVVIDQFSGTRKGKVTIEVLTRGRTVKIDAVLARANVRKGDDASALLADLDASWPMFRPGSVEIPASAGTARNGSRRRPTNATRPAPVRERAARMLLCQAGMTLRATVADTSSCSLTDTSWAPSDLIGLVDHDRALVDLLAGDLGERVGDLGGGDGAEQAAAGAGADLHVDRRWPRAWS